MEIEGNFETSVWPYIGERYTCKVTSANITTQSVEVKTFTGERQADQTDQNVEVLWICNNPNFNFIPRGIGRIFPNLVSISVDNTGLKKINADDLLGLEHLQRICLCANQLTTLPPDLFKHTGNLKIFEVEERQLKRFDPCMFDLIADGQWKRISLTTNNNSRIFYDIESTKKGLQSLKELKNAIRATFVLEEEQ
jgi:hypothetical protein